MMRFDHLDLVFPQEYLKATLMISLLTVWVLVGLFYYLNRYTKREYFGIWTAGWLFYALWLTMCANISNAPIGSTVFMIKQSCVSLSAVFLLWGSLRFLGLPVRQSLFGMFMLFLIAWTFISPDVITDRLQIQLPVFILIGSSSVFAGFCFFRMRKKKAFVGAGMLSLGFLLWGLYLGTYPLSLEYGNLYSAGFFISAVLQLFIAVSMIVLVLEEVRDNMVQKERLHAIGRMAIGMAHDVNNALFPVAGYSELLLSTLPESNKEARLFLRKISEASEKVAVIVARIREVYRDEVDPKKPGEIKPAPTIEAAVRELKPTAPPVPGGQPARALRVLYIDDEPALRELLHSALTVFHHDVTVASSGREGIELFRAHLRDNKPYEVVITDFGMPEMDGRVVARTLREESPETPIIMLTGWGKMMKEDGDIVPEVNAVIGKPARLEELNDLLLQVTAQHQHN